MAFAYGPTLPISWDTIGYNVYFTEIITDGDLKIQNLDFYDHIFKTYQNSNSFYQFVWLEEGGIITKYTSGWAIINAPFLTAAHFIAGWTGYPQDGHSQPYQIAVMISNLFYTILGLFLCRKLLLKFFSDKLTTLLITILILGTNFLDMAFVGIGLVHTYLFTFYLVLILLTIQFHQSKKIITAVWIGIVLGIMTLIRPTEILAAIIPLFYGITTLKSFIKRLKDIFIKKTYITSILIFIGVYSIQLSYWKYTTGHFFYYSYKNPGEGLDLDNPHLWELLFSFRKGWLIYTPIMVFSFIGLIKMYKYNRALFWSVGTFFLLNLYVVSSWSCWWYAASFSSRPLIQVYGLCLLLIGYAFYKSNLRLKIIYSSISFLLILLNLFQTWQYEKRIIHYDRMTMAYYFSIFGQTTPPTPEQEKLLLVERGTYQFTNQEDYNLIHTENGKFDTIILSQEDPYSPPIRFPFDQYTQQEHLWVILKADIRKLEADSVYTNNPLTVHLCGNAMHDDGIYGWTCDNLYNFDGETAKMQHDYLTPEMRFRSDSIAIGMWHQFGPPIEVSNMKIEIYEHK